MHLEQSDRGFHRFEDVLGRAVLDHLGDLRRVLQHLDRRGQLSFFRLDQLQRNDSAQDQRKLTADLFVLIGREAVDDSIDGLRRVVGVQRRKDQMAGFRCREHRGHRLDIAHLADHDHVGILAHGVAQRLAKARRVGSDLALGNRRGLVDEQKLDRIFNGHDVQRLFLGDLGDHCRERRRFSRSGRTGDDHEAVGNLRQIVDRLRQLEGVDADDLNRNAAKDSPDCAALHVEISAETRHSRDAVADVNRLIRVELFALRPVENRQQHFLQIGRLQGIGLHRNELSANAHERRAHRLQMKVRCLLLGHVDQQIVQAKRGLALCSRLGRSLDSHKSIIAVGHGCAVPRVTGIRRGAAAPYFLMTLSKIMRNASCCLESVLLITAMVSPILNRSCSSSAECEEVTTMRRAGTPF